MNCRIIREILDDWSAGADTPEDAAAVQAHLEACPDCREFQSDRELIRAALGGPVPLSDFSERTIRKRLDHKIHRNWRVDLRSLWGDARGWVRDLDRLVVWSRLAALPTTMLALLVLLWVFPRAEIERWNYTVFAARAVAEGGPAEQTLTVQVSQPRGQLNGLMDTAWKIPYEDSLWLTADIRPDGKAEIGAVIEYPKNPDLLEAVDQTLRQSKFEVAENWVDPVLIYSFQKVDVYEGGVF